VVTAEGALEMLSFLIPMRQLTCNLVKIGDACVQEVDFIFVAQLHHQHVSQKMVEVCGRSIVDGES